MVDAKRRIGYRSPSKRGARHDKRLLDQRQIVQHIPGKVTILADSGLQCLRHVGLCIPIKSSKRRPLDEQSREWNRLVSRHWVVVEHSIGGMKGYHAIAGVYRNRNPHTDDRFNLLAAGLWNYFIN